MVSFEYICRSIEDTANIAKKFTKQIEDCGAFVSMYGEIGAGKTAFIKKAAEALDVEEKVTSPSFVILNEYHTAKIPIYHFDLYRLEQEGVKTIIDELREYSQGKILTFVEWAEFSQDEIPFDHITIKVTYEDEETDSRKYLFEAFGEKSEKILKWMK